jgi:hypothetical protein
MSTPYGQKTLSLGTNTIYTCTNININCAIVQNESPYTLLCSIDGTGSKKTIAALTIDRVDVPAMGFTGNLIFTPIQVLSDVSNAPSYAILLDTYGVGEEPTGSYPVALSRAVVVSGSVNSNVTSTNAILNSGNPGGTSIISAQPSDAAAATWAADNSGNLTVKGDNGTGTLTTLIQLIAGASPAVKLAAATVLVEALGALQVDSTLTVQGNTTLQGNATIQGSGGVTSTSGAYYGTDPSNTIIQSSGTSGTGNTRIQNTDHISVQVPGGSEVIGVTSSQVTVQQSIIFKGLLGVSASGDVIDASTGADTYIKCRSGGNINFQSPNGTTVAHFDTSGQLNVSHSIILVSGSLGQLKNFSGTGSATVATGITNPTSICFDPCTASGSSQTLGGTIASSSVVTAGAGLAWAGTAWHS